MDINQKTIKGGIVRAPKITGSSATSYLILTVATTRYVTIGQERKEKKTYHRVVVKNQNAVARIANAKVGDQVFVMGFDDDYQFVHQAGHTVYGQQLVAETIELIQKPPRYDNGTDHGPQDFDQNGGGHEGNFEGSYDQGAQSNYQGNNQGPPQRPTRPSNQPQSRGNGGYYDQQPERQHSSQSRSPQQRSQPANPTTSRPQQRNDQRSMPPVRQAPQSHNNGNGYQQHNNQNFHHHNQDQFGDPADDIPQHFGGDEFSGMEDEIRAGGYR